MTRLIVVSAPSGAGKSTLCERLLQDIPELRLSISSTTRPPRGQEKNGKEYFFLTREEFESQIRAQRFAEWALVHGNYYGTSRDFIEKVLAAGNSVLLDIDVQGAESLRKAYPGKTVLVFIEPPNLAALERRLRNRGTESEENIRRRMKNAEMEMKRKEGFDHTIVNDDLQRAYVELRTIVKRAVEQEDNV